ncbi:hypothetical protein Poly30_55820 [Planctomycetes bacterium Poly30]|uniref:Uncharacterized protein n=1 Tax=Saltatorellus ferox TaxID=2528018 RepID=A0A518F0Z7_9BACT|nr:hypothetical protein Poly30_55820 [Planctomycetes bacterium Poly30]
MHDPLRPTFERDVPEIDVATLLERIVAALNSEDGGLPHRRAGHHLMIWLPKSEQHLWSPWLHLDVNENEERPGTARLFGRFTPAPNMWTALMFTYLVLGVLALAGGIFGYSQHLVGESPWGLWVIPACAFVAVFIPLASRAGQALAKEQMGLLSGVIERALPASHRS